MKRIHRVVVGSAALLLAVCGASFGIVEGRAEAAANPGSNCAAVLTSHFGPQGAVDDAVHILQQAAAEQGMTFGQLARIVAQTEGSLNDCLALVGQPPVG
jgi:hypothetical protein